LVIFGGIFCNPLFERFLSTFLERIGHKKDPKMAHFMPFYTFFGVFWSKKGPFLDPFLDPFLICKCP
jgi:hypothetical protein